MSIETHLDEGEQSGGDLGVPDVGLEGRHPERLLMGMTKAVVVSEAE